MSEKLAITVPINKTYFNTFINSFIPIHFFNDHSFTLESLKNLLFPPEHNDKDFNDLVNFIKIVFDEYIKNNKDQETLKKELIASYLFEDDVINSIVTILLTKRTEILNQINSKFNKDTFIYQNVNWSTKSIISSNRDEYFPERYSDLEFLYTEGNNSELKHKNVTLTKGDFDKMFRELKKIKENLNKINTIK